MYYHLILSQLEVVFISSQYGCCDVFYWLYVQLSIICMVIFYCYLIVLTTIKHKKLPYDAYAKFQLLYGKSLYNIKSSHISFLTTIKPKTVPYFNELIQNLLITC